ncbi:TerB family tellurite resistance protein [Pleionea litopenaei]|uniref:TerB family tellurite resistance protein n=1 Tax=Pleionea litopenaei TaxID=3070815 RepID=A0AA51X6X5_9GAMM|nr:TerB family tellurite resistance protein [Pleionea sp. HL-JVS1]WMS87593.1 TerB family tellurite resistance protein [Pleionea sp. HL-JVS1]
MHIIIGVITAIAGLLWALNRLNESGFNLNSLNPFLWARRRKWEKAHGTKPIHRLENSLEAAALLVSGMALIDGAVSRETKELVIDLFQKEFGISEQQSLDLYNVSSHLLKDTDNLSAEVKMILAPSINTFSESNQQQLMSMLNEVAKVEGGISNNQKNLLEAIAKQFNRIQSQPTWH